MHTPLADRIRPQSIDEIVGQQHLIGEGKPLRNIIESGELPNLIFYGPSGTGKTTLARMIAKKTDRTLRKLNCTTAGTQDIRDSVEDLNAFTAPNGILLYLDEIQYFNKKQQQTLLEYIEDGSITLIASTTENPYFYVYNAILSRSSVFEFKPLEKDDVEKAVKRGVTAMKWDPFGKNYLNISNAELDKALRNVAAVRIKEVMDIEAVNVVDVANLPEGPSSPNTMKNTAIGFAAGLFIAAAAYTLVFILDDTIKTPDDVERVLGVSVLAVIPYDEAADTVLMRKRLRKNRKKKGRKVLEAQNVAETMSATEESMGNGKTE